MSDPESATGADAPSAAHDEPLSPPGDPPAAAPAAAAAQPAPASAGDSGQGEIAATPAEQPPTAPRSGFAARGRVRRRLRFLRKARELAYRDLGGLVFNLHRFGQRNDALVLAKLGVLAQIDGELRTLEQVLSERRPVTVLREAGITACPRCAAIHGSEDRFCPNCGIPVGRHADLPVANTAAPPLAPQPLTAPVPYVQAPPAASAPAASPAEPIAQPAATAAAPVQPSPEQPAPSGLRAPAAPPTGGTGRSPEPPARAAPASAAAPGLLQPAEPVDAADGLTQALRGSQPGS